MLKVFCTGVSGTGVKAGLEEILDVVPPGERPAWEIIDVGDLMHELDRPPPGQDHVARGKWEDSILTRAAALKHIRTAAFDRLNSQVARLEEEGRVRVLLISSHITFRVPPPNLLTGSNPVHLLNLEPNLFITFLDDTIKTWRALQETNQKRWQELTPIDLLLWCQEEIFVTQFAAELMEKHFFLWPRRQPPSTFYRLVHSHLQGDSSPPLKRFYLSYPMTFVQDRPEVQQTANQIGERLGERAIVFNPGTVEDIATLKELADGLEQIRKKQGLTLGDAERKRLEDLVKGATVERDHQLIDQSDGIVVYYPPISLDQAVEGQETIPFSSGVLDEMHYATQTGKDVYLIWPSRRDPGPFLPTIYTEQFADLDGLLEFWDREGDNKESG